MKSGLDSATGANGSLADSPAFSSVAAELDAHDAYWALLSNEVYTLRHVEFAHTPLGLSPEELDRAEQQLAAQRSESPTLPPYQAMGLGHGLSNGVPLLIVSFAMSDPESAEDMLDAFAVVIDRGGSWDYEASWSDVFVIREAEVVGNVATIVLETDSPGRGLQAFRGVDSLFIVDS